MLICIIDTEDNPSAGLQAILTSLAGALGLEAQGAGTGSGASGAQVYSAPVTGSAMEQAAADPATLAGGPLGTTAGGIEPSAGIDPTDHLISPQVGIGYTADGSPLIPLDLGNGQIVYVTPPVAQEPLPPVEQAPGLTPIYQSPYEVAPPYITDPTDNLIPQNGFDQFQYGFPVTPSYAPPIPVEPSSDELAAWIANERALAVQRHQAQTFGDMQARAVIPPGTPTPDFTGFPQTPQVEHRPPTPNI